MDRLRAVQCRPSTLNPPNLELGNSEQGKYEEEKKEIKQRPGARREFIAPSVLPWPHSHIWFPQAVKGCVPPMPAKHVTRTKFPARVLGLACGLWSVCSPPPPSAVLATTTVGHRNPSIKLSSISISPKFQRLTTRPTNPTTGAGVIADSHNGTLMYSTDGDYAL